MRVLITGASGMLGSTLAERWRERHEVLATGGPAFTAPSGWAYLPFDLGASDHTPLIAWAQPEIIVHCAALTSVDACEAAPQRALEVNGNSVARLLSAAPQARMLFISTDAVFGERAAPLSEAEPVAPINAYGRSKALGEALLAERAAGLTVRTTVVGWNQDPKKQSFVEWLVRSIERRQQVTLFRDALFNPIAASQLADELEPLLAADVRGVYHVSGREGVSKEAFGRALCARLGIDVGVVSSGTIKDVQFAARRSSDQRLDVAKFEETFGRRLPTMAATIDALAESRRVSGAAP